MRFVEEDLGTHKKKRARGYTLQRGRRGLAGVGVGVGSAVLKLPCTKFGL